MKLHLNNRPCSVFNSRAWLIAVVSCAVALGLVPLVSMTPGYSIIAQLAAALVVMFAGLSLLFRFPSVHPAVIAYVCLVLFWGITVEPESRVLYGTFVKLAVFAVAVHVLVRTPRHLTIVLGGYALSALLTLLFNWGEISSIRADMETHSMGSSVDRLRFTGSFGNANQAGLFAAVATFCGLCVFFNTRGRFRWAVLICSAGSGLVIAGLTGSRTGLIALFIVALGAPLMAVAGRPGNVFLKTAKFTLLLGVFLVIAAASVIQLPQFERFTRLERGVDADSSTATRWDMAMSSLKVWEEHPLVGAGFRGFERVSDFPGRPAHTTYGQVLADSGLVGFALLVVFLGLPGLHLLGLAMNHRDRRMQRLAMALLVLWAVVVVTALVAELHGRRDLVPLWAALCGVIQQHRVGRRLALAAEARTRRLRRVDHRNPFGRGQPDGVTRPARGFARSVSSANSRS